jgi:DNA-binding winged helix-turn-helix (wHTH) protein
VVRFGRFTLDGARRQLTRDDIDVHVTPKAFDLLVLLTSEAPGVILKSSLHARLWPGSYVSDSTLVSLVKELRRALEDHDRDAPIIRTAHRVGYAFCLPIESDHAKTRSEVDHWLVLPDRRLALREGDNIVGRDPAVNVWVDAPGVSRRHARITIDGPRVHLEDLGSKNGTLLSGSSVVGSMALRDGDEIAFGAIRVRYRAPSAQTTTLARLPAAATDRLARGR